jgi:hypothetical protein
MQNNFRAKRFTPSEARRRAGNAGASAKRGPGAVMHQPEGMPVLFFAGFDPGLHLEGSFLYPWFYR